MVGSPVFHLVCGGTGAGKSTYARRLTAQVAGVRFSLDEWMATLFAPDAPQPLQYGWALERVARCETQIGATATALATTGVSSILDLSFARATQRRSWAAIAAAAGAEVRLHVLEVDVAERWRRVERRNAEKGATFSLEVDRGVFDFFEDLWQEPTAEEFTAMGGVSVHSAP